MSDKKNKKGMVLGKFLPPHKGHQYLIDYAKNNVDELFIIVDNIHNDIIEVSKRIEWVQQMCPSAKVLTLKKSLPQFPEDAPDDFWQQWEAGLKDILTDNIDFVFASEEYGEKLAFILDAQFVMVDLERKNIPICASEIRKNPYKNWEYIADVVKPYYCKKVCVFGPESVGKSTLAENLAKHYSASFVPEYARDVIETVGGNINYEHMEEIAIGHNQRITKGLSSANKILFVDTDAITTKIWSEELFNNYPKIVDEIINDSDFDLYLLLDVDVPWVADIVRYRPNDRKNFFEKCRIELENYKKHYVIVSGTWDNRLEQSICEIDKILNYNL